MSGALVIAEHRQGALRDVTAELVGAATALGAGPVAVAVIAEAPGAFAEACSFAGVDELVEVAAAGPHFDADVWRAAVEALVRERLALQLPAVVSVQTGINSPRYVNFRQLKAAEGTEIEVRGGADAPGATGWAMAEPPAGEGAEMLPGRAADVAQRIVNLVTERRS